MSKMQKAYDFSLPQWFTSSVNFILFLTNENIYSTQNHLVYMFQSGKNGKRQLNKNTEFVHKV